MQNAAFLSLGRIYHHVLNKIIGPKTTFRPAEKSNAICGSRQVAEASSALWVVEEAASGAKNSSSDIRSVSGGRHNV